MGGYGGKEAQLVGSNRDIVQVIMGHLSYRDFIDARLVCHVWRNVSENCQKQWWEKLHTYAERHTSIHKKVHVEQDCWRTQRNMPCRCNSHYKLGDFAPPNTTRPLFLQVFAIGAKAAEKTALTRVRRATDLLEQYNEREKEAARLKRAWVASRQKALDFAAQATADRTALLESARKRAKIDISKVVIE